MAENKKNLEVTIQTKELKFAHSGKDVYEDPKIKNESDNGNVIDSLKSKSFEELKILVTVNIVTSVYPVAEPIGNSA